MKKCSIFLITVSCFAHAIFAQTVIPGYVDGVVHFKLNDNSLLELDPYQNTIPALNLIFVNYAVDTIFKPFKLPSTSLDKIYRLKFSNSASVENLIADLELIPDVEFAEKIPLYETTSTPNDLQLQQWSLYKVQAEQAWNLSTGNAGVVIAIVDNAILHSHADLAANRWINSAEQGGLALFDDDLNGYIDDIYGYDVADNDNNPEPPSGTNNGSAFIHGTHVAGIAAAATNNGTGIASLGYNCRFMSVKCSQNSSQGNSLSNAQDGVFYAMQSGADVINMSFGSAGGGLVSQLVINQAYSAGIVLVGAAGNDNSTAENYPGAFPNVIAVGATNQSDTKAGFSNYGVWVDVMAPGEGIYSTLPESGNTYGERSGTSMATPLVAGLAGLVRSYSPGLSNAQVRDKIIQGCENIDGLNSGLEGMLGAGRINALQSLNPLGIAAISPDTSVSFFPNPVHSGNSLFVKRTGNNTGKFAFNVFDVTGKLIFTGQTTLPANGVTELTAIKKLPSGVYSLSLTSAQQIHTQKIIIL